MAWSRVAKTHEFTLVPDLPPLALLQSECIVQMHSKIAVPARLQSLVHRAVFPRKGEPGRSGATPSVWARGVEVVGREGGDGGSRLVPFRGLIPWGCHLSLCVSQLMWDCGYPTDRRFVKKVPPHGNIVTGSQPNVSERVDLWSANFDGPITPRVLLEGYLLKPLLDMIEKGKQKRFDNSVSSRRSRG